MQSVTLAVLAILSSVFSFAQTIPYRQYKSGEELVYKLTTQSWQNDKSSGKSEAIARLSVIKDSAQWADQVSWEHKISMNGKDTLQLDSAARNISPYTISLVPGGKVLLPKLTSAEMVGEITDLNTFFVAVSPKLKIQQLNRKHPAIQNEEIATGNFADGRMILKGTDCIRVTHTLLQSSRRYSVVKTSFEPPQDFCLDPYIDTIRTPVATHPNNFQMIRKSAGDLVNLLWGTETFIIISKIDKRTGKILEATMTNTLQLRMRVNASSDLKSHQIEMPYKIYRELKLELMPVAGNRHTGS